MERCKFCQIADKEVKDNLIWENERFMLLLDNHPARNGHCMLIPKEHIVHVYDMNHELTCEMFELVKRFIKPLLDYTNARKIGYLVKGFSVPHAHLHLIPLYDEERRMDGIFEEGDKIDLTLITLGIRIKFEDYGLL